MLSLIQKDLQNAQLAKDSMKVETLRMLISELKYAEIQKGGKLDEQAEVSVVQREIKKRKEAAEGFRKGGREDSAKKEESEAKILEVYLPAQLSDEDLKLMIDEAIKETNASQISDMGKVIGIVMSKVAGQADGGRVSGLVKAKLQNG
jgi:uncharacterized protein YqeY